MEKFTTSPSALSLTLSWGKATTPEKITHPYRYFIAGGATLRKIEEVIANHATLPQACADLAAEVGARSYDIEDGFVFDYDRADLIPATGKEAVRNSYGNSVPMGERDRVSPKLPGFVMWNSFGNGNFFPDENSQRGREIGEKCADLRGRAQPMWTFAKWLGSFNVDTKPGYGGSEKLNAKANRVGDQWIVAVPVVYNKTGYGEADDKITESLVVPPDSTPIMISEYYAMLEKNNLLQNMPRQANRPSVA